MKVTPDDYGRRCQFDHFCKLVLYHEAIDYLREMQRRRDRELSFSDLPQMEIENIGNELVLVLMFHDGIAALRQIGEKLRAVVSSVETISA